MYVLLVFYISYVNVLANDVFLHLMINLPGPLLTGGEKVGGTWMWEQVTIDDEPRSEQDIAATFSTLLKPVEASKWFPGKVHRP